MKALIAPQYGSPDTLEISDIAIPTIKDNEVLIKVYASSINSHDHRTLKGKPFLVRLKYGLFKPQKNNILGTDIAGVVETVGKNVTKYKAGDAVYGCLADNGGGGGFAEYVCAAENTIAFAAQGISYEEAASLPMAAVTALQGLRDLGKIRAGQKVLINGASGGVGSFAVQIAKAYNTEVTAVCSNRNIQFLRDIGADHVIDYAKADFSQDNKTYDLIIDIAANHSLREIRRVLKPNGTCVVIGFSCFSYLLQVMLKGAGKAKNQNKNVVMLMADNSKKEDLDFINTLYESQKLKPLIDEVYTLDNAKKAFEYFEKEHARGKVVIKIV